MSLSGRYRSLIRGGLLMLIALGLLAGSGVINQREADAQGSGLYRAIKSVNIRSKASSDSKILATVPKYAIVATLGPAKGCGAHSCAWIKVAFDGVEGWAIGSRIEPALVIRGTAVANERVNLRATPGDGGEILAVIPVGGKMKLTGQQAYPCVSVEYKGIKGWVVADYLTSYPSPQR